MKPQQIDEDYNNTNANAIKFLALSYIERNNLRLSYNGVVVFTFIREEEKY